MTANSEAFSNRFEFMCTFSHHDATLTVESFVTVGSPEVNGIK